MSTLSTLKPLTLAEAEKKSCIFSWQQDLSDRIGRLADFIRAQRKVIGERP